MKTIASINCTCCGKKIVTIQDVRLHPLLKTAQCISCSHTYSQVGDLSKYRGGVDITGESNYCRWCLDGGSLYPCGHKLCKNSFCDICLIRNLGDAATKDIDDDWLCPACDESKLQKIRLKVEKYINKMKIMRQPKTIELELPSKQESDDAPIIIDEPTTPPDLKLKPQNADSEPMIDPEPEPILESLPEAILEPVPEAILESEPMPESEPVPSTEPESEPTSESRLEQEPESELEPVQVTDTEPKSGSTPEVEPVTASEQVSVIKPLASTEPAIVPEPVTAPELMSEQEPMRLSEPTSVSVQMSVLEQIENLETVPEPDQASEAEKFQDCVSALEPHQTSEPQQTPNPELTPEHEPTVTTKKPFQFKIFSSSKLSLKPPPRVIIPEPMEVDDIDVSSLVTNENHEPITPLLDKQDNLKTAELENSSSMDLEQELYISDDDTTDNETNVKESSPTDWLLTNADILKERLRIFADSFKSSIDTFDVEAFRSDPNELMSWVSNVSTYLEAAPLVEFRCQGLKEMISDTYKS